MKFNNYTVKNSVVYDKGKDYVKQYDLESLLLTKRIIFLQEQITSRAANDTISKLIYLESISHEKISLYINCYGGSIYDGFAIMDTMDFLFSNVETICFGKAMSMGALILMNGSKRYALPRSRILLHQPLIQKLQENLKTSDLHILSKEMTFLQESIVEFIVQHCNNKTLTIKKINELLNKGDFYLSALSCLKYGFIDKIIDKKK